MRGPDETSEARLRKLTLRFVDPEDERRFQTAIKDGRVRIARIGIGAAIVLNAVYTIWDRLAFSEALALVTIIREALMTVFLGLDLAATFVRSWQGSVNRVMAVGVLGYVTFFGAINTLEPTPYIFVANGSLIVVFPYLFVIGDLPLAALTGLSSAIVFAGILGSARPIDSAYVIFCLLLAATNFMGVIFAYQLEFFRRREFSMGQVLAGERARYRELLVSVLPETIADRLGRGENIADLHDRVVVLFADIVGFTPIAARHQPNVVVRWLDALFRDFDAVAEAHGLEKIKTIGDAYMAAHGLAGAKGSCVAVVDAAMDLLALAERRQTPDGSPVHLRIGVHTGPALAGIIGRKRFLYDLWGDTVNVASRMEAASKPGCILVTPEVRAELDQAYSFEECAETFVKGKGTMVTWLLRGPKPTAAS